jgi:hypothetical protein
MADKGVVYIALGEAAVSEQQASLKTLRQYHPDWKVYTFGSEMRIGQKSDFIPTAGQKEILRSMSRGLKVDLYNLSPFDETLYLDADTRVRGSLQCGFDYLEAGCELVIAPSSQQGEDWLWHVSEEERNQTEAEIGYKPLQLQAGVMWFRKCVSIEKLFTAWREEWSRYKGEDQGALLRAMKRAPVKIWLLSHEYVETIIQHQFGACRK